VAICYYNCQIYHKSSPYGVKNITLILNSGDITSDIQKGMQNDNGSSVNLFGATFPYHNARNETDVRRGYDMALTQIFPVFLTFHYEGDAATETVSSLNCIRANKLAEGSREPNISVRQTGTGYIIAPSIVLAVLAASAPSIVWSFL
jgi:hypothetical protein